MSYIGKTIMQGIGCAVVIEALLFAYNYRLIMTMLNIRNKEDDFSYQDSYFVVYRGILEDYPKLAVLFWGVIIFVALIMLFGMVKWVWKQFV